MVWNANDPVLEALLEVPEDDDPETEEERAAVEEVRKNLREGRISIPARVKSELGL